MKKVFLALITLSVLLLSAQQSYADNCSGQYGQNCTSPSYSILIDKQVGKITGTNKGGTPNYEYVDNLTPSDPRFQPNSEVMFRLRVQNTMSTDITNVQVKDFVPSWVTPVEGPGSFDSSSRTLSFNAGDFKVNEEKIYYLKMKVHAQNNLPADKGLFCMVNKAQAYTDKTSDEDTSQFCVEKQVTGVTTSPSAGPEMWLPLLTLEASGFIGGIYLIHMSKKKNKA